MNTLVRTLALMATSTGFAVTIGWIYAYLCERWAGRWAACWRMVPIASVSLPLFIHAAGWEATVGKFGWLPLSGVTAREFFFGGFWASFWIHSITGSAWVAVIVGAFLRRGPVPGEQAARLEVTGFHTATSVVLPATYAVTLMAGLWVAILAATDISVVDLYGYRTLADEVYVQYNLSPNPLPPLAAAMLPLLLVMAAVVLAWSRRRGMQRPWFGSISETSTISPTMPSVLRQIACQGWIGIWAAAMLAIPIASLVAKAGWTVRSEQGIVSAGWSMAQCVATIKQSVSMFGAEFYWTAMLAAVVIAMTLPVAWSMAWMGRHRPTITILVSVMLMIVPGPVVSMLLMTGFTHFESPLLATLYDKTLIPTGLSVLYRSAPLGCFIFMAAYYQSNRRTDQIALMDGLSLAQRFRAVEWPRLRTPVILTSLISGLLALSEISATEMVLPPSVSTVSRRLFGLLHSGVRNQEAGLCLISIAGVLSLVTLACVLSGIARSTRTSPTNQQARR